MKNFLSFLTLILSFAFDAGASPATQGSTTADPTSTSICKIVNYIQSLGGPMITIVIIGAALLAIFGRMPWPALFALGAFTAVFFGAPKIVEVIAPGQIAGRCCPENQTWHPGTGSNPGSCR